MSSIHDDIQNFCRCRFHQRRSILRFNPVSKGSVITLYYVYPFHFLLKTVESAKLSEYSSLWSYFKISLVIKKISFPRSEIPSNYLISVALKAKSFIIKAFIIVGIFIDPMSISIKSKEVFYVVVSRILSILFYPVNFWYLIILIQYN